MSLTLIGNTSNELDIAGGVDMSFETIPAGAVTDAYVGYGGCACGCGGTYETEGPTFKRRINRANKLLDTSPCQTFGPWSDRLVVEWVTGNSTYRVLRLVLSVDALGISPDAAETVAVLCRDGMGFGPALRAAAALD
jgi:hypothetical protein